MTVHFAIAIHSKALPVLIAIIQPLAQQPFNTVMIVIQPQVSLEPDQVKTVESAQREASDEKDAHLSKAYAS